MESTYHSKDFMEIPSSSRFPSRVSESLDDCYFTFNSSDESFNSNRSSNSSKSLEKTNDVIRKCDLSNDDGNSSGGNSLSETDTNDRRRNYKSIIKFLKNFKPKTEGRSEQQSKNQSILRRPTEYTFVRGMSGLPLRVIKSSTSTGNCCSRCTASRN